MREFRWSWADVGLLKSGLAKAGAGWHSADRAGQAIEKLERLKLKDRARPLHFIVKGKKEFRFADAGQAVAFLRPLADADALRAVKTRKPLQDVDQLLGELPDAQKARISRSLHCPSGHPIQRKGESLKWYQDAKTCDACRKPICAKSDYWRCTKNCKYNVCHHCFQDAGNNAALLFAEHCSESLANTSQASTSEGPPSDEVLADGPCVELTVHFQGRRETAAFDSARPLAPQMSALEHALHSEVWAEDDDGSCAQEVLQSELQLQAIPPGADVAAEPVTQLASSSWWQSCDLASMMERHLEETREDPLEYFRGHTNRCAKEELATEVLNQGGLSVFLGALRAENAAAELASTGLCAFLQHPRRRAEVVELLSKDWQTYGPRLMPALLRALVSDGPPARASMALLLWLLEEVEGAPGAFHAAAMRQEADDGAPGYRQLAATAHGAAALRRAQQKAPVALRESMCEAVDAEVHGGFMEDLLKEQSSHEVLSILTASCATPQAACTELQRQQATQIKEEKKFTEMLQGKLRQSHRALQAMAPLVKLGDPDLERTLASILQNGWESAFRRPFGEGEVVRKPNAIIDILSKIQFELTTLNDAARHDFAHKVEHSEDPRAVQLVSELCPDLEARDEKGLRAMDYAMQNPSSEVADQLLKVSRARACQSFGPLEDDVYGQNLEVIQEHEPPSAVSISDPKLSEIKQSVVLGKDGETEHGTIGALFVLRTQLSAALRENEDSLKSGVKEFIRDVAGSDNISASASECEPVPEPPASVAASSPDASPTPREVPTEAASPKLLAPPRGKAKGKGKGPQLPSPSPSPSEGSSAASDIGDATPTPSSSKGKGKSKGPPPAPGSRPAGAETGEKGKGKGKGKAAVEPTKPTVKPMQDLKTLPWTRYVVGAQLQQGTIWDKVNVVYDEDHIMESLPLEAPVNARANVRTCRIYWPCQ
ncbi:hypothetical protein AK812_SmicGene29080 [Symbiodinium microadriaticum]|uniref:Uncharacterized protein n=1 Tax=Symbiodinium microadriaticum TaxID=2951 RepID=A0A1Q9D2R6_SYMMI|nr:hypothetical protein AK812_SmicGene29080 [Symbiodinium microadriaticum]